MRVIFDRSAFHGQRFDQLVASPLRALCRSGRITVIHTPIFLEETLSTYNSSSAAPGDWQRHLTFALDVCNGGFLLERDDIWHQELVCGRGRYAPYLHPERATRRHISREQLEQRLRAAAQSGDLSEEWRESLTDRNDTQLRKSKQKETF